MSYRPSDPVSAGVSGATVTGKYRFGIATGLEGQSAADMGRELDEVVALGAGFIRNEFSWPASNTAAGVYDWTLPDIMVNAVAARGLKMIGTFSKTPTWAQQASSGIWYPPNDLNSSGSANFNTFVTAAVNRYKPGAGIISGSVSHWEIWNEPNFNTFWTDTVASPHPNAQRYTWLLKGAYTAAKAADPTCVVIPAGLATTQYYNAGNVDQINMVNFYETMYANGAAGYFDAANVHCYHLFGNTFTQRNSGGTIGSTDKYNGWFSMYGPTPSIRSLMVANGDGNKKIWATEWGGYQAADSTHDLPAAGTAPATPWTAGGTRTWPYAEPYIIDLIKSDCDHWVRMPFTGLLCYYQLRNDSSSDESLALSTWTASVAGSSATRKDRWYAIQDRYRHYAVGD